MRKQFAAALCVLAVVCVPSVSFAGEWQQDETGWRWQQDDGSYAAGGWQWLDGNADGTAECYYFDESGYMLKSIVTPDGYTVNAAGAWTVGSEVQTMQTENLTAAAQTGEAAGGEAETTASSWGAAAEIDVQEYTDGMYVLDAMHTKAYLLIGDDRALLIDTLLESDDVAAEAAKLTDLPIDVLITHGHPDHIGGVSYFGACLIHEADAYLLPEGIEAAYVAGGDVITCGDFTLEVIEIPGHSAGSIALLDRAHRFLITGDSVQEGPIIMYGEGVDMEAYAASMLRLMDYADDVDAIFAGHNRKPVGTEYLQYCYEDALAYLNGELEGTPRSLAGTTGHVYQGGHVAFYAE